MKLFRRLIMIALTTLLFAGGFSVVENNEIDATAHEHFYYHYANLRFQFKKVWKDNDNANNTRPDSFTLRFKFYECTYEDNSASVVTSRKLVGEKEVTVSKNDPNVEIRDENTWYYELYLEDYKNTRIDQIYIEEINSNNYQPEFKGNFEYSYYNNPITYIENNGIIWDSNVGGYIATLYRPYTDVEESDEEYNGEKIVTKTFDMTLTNTYEELVDLNVKKVWDVDEGFKQHIPDLIGLQLTRDGEPFGKKYYVGNFNNWECSATDLLKYNPETGEEYNYSFIETDLDQSTYFSSGSVTREGNDFTITNVSKRIKYEMEKQFVGLDESDFPIRCTFDIYADGKYLKSFELVSEDGQTISHVIDDLPRYCYEDGVLKGIEYVVKEKENDKYRSQYVQRQIFQPTYNVINTFINTKRKTQVFIYKAWLDAENKDRPEELKFIVSGSDGSKREVTLNKDSAVEAFTDSDGFYKFINTIPYNDHENIQPYFFTNRTSWYTLVDDLPYLDSEGNVIEYTVKEEDVIDGYKSKFESVVSKDNNENARFAGQVVIYRFHNIKDEIEVEKRWNDNNNADEIRPKEITVKLYKDDELYKTAKLNESNKWKYTFKDLDLYELPTYDEFWDDEMLDIYMRVYAYNTGTEEEYYDAVVRKMTARLAHEYRIEEEYTDVIGDKDTRKTYQAKISGNIKDGFTITNTHTVVRPPIPKTGVE